MMLCWYSLTVPHFVIVGLFDCRFNGMKSYLIFVIFQAIIYGRYGCCTVYQSCNQCILCEVIYFAVIMYEVWRLPIYIHEISSELPHFVIAVIEYIASWFIIAIGQTFDESGMSPFPDDLLENFTAIGIYKHLYYDWFELVFHVLCNIKGLKTRELSKCSTQKLCYLLATICFQ